MWFRGRRLRRKPCLTADCEPTLAFDTVPWETLLYYKAGCRETSEAALVFCFWERDYSAAGLLKTRTVRSSPATSNSCAFDPHAVLVSSAALSSLLASNSQLLYA